MTVNYSEDELYLLAAVPQMIGSAMTFAGGSGLFGTGKELFTSAKSVLAGVKDYPGNALIQAVVPNLSGDRQAAMEQARKCRDWATARLKAKGINSSEKLRLQALADCREAASLLASKSSSQGRPSTSNGPFRLRKRWPRPRQRAGSSVSAASA